MRVALFGATNFLSPQHFYEKKFIRSHRCDAPWGATPSNRFYKICAV